MTELEVDMFWLLVVAVYPSAVLAFCKAPTVKDVLMYDATFNVTWVATYEPGCLKGFQVCWTAMHDKDVTCDFAPAGATSLHISDQGMDPCERFSVEVTAISHDQKYRDSRYAHGIAGPPKITGLKLTRSSRHLATLEWSPMSDDSCVSNVELWLCDNSTQELGTCVYKKMSSATVKFEFQGFEACRYYYVTMRTVSGRSWSPTTTLEIYLDSANEVTSVEVSNITKDSAVIAWSVSDIKFRCQTERMKLCLQEEGTRMLPDCWEWTLDEDNPEDSITISDLESCAAYDVMVSLVTEGKYSHKKVTFTTPMAIKALTATTEGVANTAAVVRWSYDVASTDCKPTVMQVCYHRSDIGGSSKMCRTLGTAKKSSVRLSNLAPCTLYAVSLMLLTSVGPQPNYTLSLVTASKDLPVLDSMNLTASSSSITVQWTPVDSSLQCVSHYKVSWTTPPLGRVRGWRAVGANATSFTIPGASRRATYQVEVAAVFVDGTSQFLSGSVAPSGSTRLLSKLSQLLSMLPVVVLLREQLQR